jgi:hypothetical protein
VPFWQTSPEEHALLEQQVSPVLPHWVQVLFWQTVLPLHPGPAWQHVCPCAPQDALQVGAGACAHPHSGGRRRVL